jgi:hypothetical protein
MSSTRVFALAVLTFVACTLVGCQTDVFGVALSTPSPTVVVVVSPTPTPSPLPTAAARPSPTSVAIPPRPEDFEDYASTILAFLNASQGDEDGLRTMLEGWEALQHVSDLLRVDVDDDGVGEFVAVVVDPSEEYGINLRGDLLVVDKDGEDFTLVYSAAGDSTLTDPALLEVDDLNGDGHTEIAYSSTSCGAHTCYITVQIVSSGTGTFEDLTGGGIGMSYAQAGFVDWDGDGVQDLVLQGGTIGSVGAGPQRERMESYKWDGRSYVLSETAYAPSNYLYFKVLDANGALLDGEYERAVLLYREAIDDDTLQIWMKEQEREELAAFSRYRLSLSYLLMGEDALAQDVREELLSAQRDDIYAQVVDVLWDAYAQDGDLRAACERVGEFAADHPETASVLADYGYANPTFTPEEVCPIDLF